MLDRLISIGMLIIARIDRILFHAQTKRKTRREIFSLNGGEKGCFASLWPLRLEIQTADTRNCYDYLCTLEFIFILSKHRVGDALKRLFNPR